VCFPSGPVLGYTRFPRRREGTRMQMTNTIFYTFSTIAQTLAGAIALLGRAGRCWG